MRSLQAVLVLALLGPTVLARAVGAQENDLSAADLSGRWYILVHYKDARSVDKSITKFKDFAWSIEQSEKRIVLQAFPYVLFDEGTELVRRHAMNNHLPWEPDEALWARIRQGVRISQRAATRKRLKGSLERGFESSPGMGLGGINTVSFERNWKIRHAAQQIRVEIIDSLSGSEGLEGIEDSILYVIDQRVAPDEFRGTYSEPTKSGTFRMVRSREFETE